jgi:hypothetical protein
MRASPDHRANVALATGVLVLFAVLVFVAGIGGMAWCLMRVAT